MVQGRASQSPITGVPLPLGLKHTWQPIKGAFTAQVRIRDPHNSSHITNREKFLSPFS
ncbi:hypothetical protein MtrunA17_Chr7g0226141 [Medicago truncatula]|uniref:Uncharacterized protein n=1 Tax=Medicago truncatula TaxID=3880 RepID=A0A396GVA9_MEDTR|nr:hypothetical protein MtrunA17_Chr7g0226141 [Medicago truncatula]